MLLVRRNGIVYGRLNGTVFTPTEALDRLDPKDPVSRDVRIMVQRAIQAREKHGVDIVATVVPSHRTGRLI